MELLVREFLSQKKFAVVGSFRNEEKYAYKIFRKLRKNGFFAVPVNPSKKEVDGIRCYSSIKEIDENVDAVVFITPPKQTERLLNECLEKNISKVWIQPGAESKEAIDFCRKNNIDAIYNMCILITRMPSE